MALRKAHNTNLSADRKKRLNFFKAKIPEYKKNPVLFAEEVLRFEPDPWQKSALMDLADSPKVSVKSGQGVGKSSLQAVALLWFILCFPYPRIVATAPTKQQLHDVLWSEVYKWMSRSSLLREILKWTKTYVYMSGNEKRWFAVTKTATKPENMQGFHEDNMLFIIDEASGVAEPIMEAILGTLSGKNNKLLMCGNPTRTTGTFYDSHTADRTSYKCHTISSADSSRTSKENIESLVKKYGWESNVVKVRVRGEFPDQEDDVFIPISLIEQSINSEPKELKEGEEPDSIHIGCDVARYGSDKTVIGYSVDDKVSFHKKRRGQDLMKTADDIVFLGEMLISKHGYKRKIPVKVDDGGLGGGVTDRLRMIKRNDPVRFWWMEIFPVTFGTQVKHIHYYDSTTYMMGILKKLLSTVDDKGKPKPPDLILPNDSDLVAQLSTRKYRVTERAKIKIESKEELKKRKLPSPDEADCVLLICLPVHMKEEK